MLALDERMLIVELSQCLLSCLAPLHDVVFLLNVTDQLPIQVCSRILQGFHSNAQCLDLFELLLVHLHLPVEI